LIIKKKKKEICDAEICDEKDKALGISLLCASIAQNKPIWNLITCSLSCHSLLVLISNIGSQILSDVWSLLTHPLWSDIMQQFLFSHAAYRSTPNNHMMCVVK